MKRHIAIKHVYDPPSPADGKRVLVDRIWPRGLRKDAAALDAWVKEVAPSTALRKWYGHEPARWPEFRRRYRAELAENPDALAELKALAASGTTTLLYAAHDGEHSNAAVLKEWLDKPPRGRTAG